MFPHQLLLQVLVEAQYKDPLSGACADICVYGRHLRTGLFLNDLRQERARAFDKSLPDLLDELCAIAIFGQLFLGRRQDAFEPDEHHILYNECPRLLRPPAQVIFFKLRYGRTDFRFELSFGFVRNWFVIYK